VGRQGRQVDLDGDGDLVLTRRPAGDEGTTLAELVVCMCLTTLVGAIALGFFVWTGKATRATTANSFTNQNARSAMSTAAGLLRLAVPGSITPGATAVTFSASDTVTAGCGRRPAATISLSVVSGELRMSRTGPQSNPGPTTPCAYKTSVASSKVLASGVQAGSGFQFSYREVNGVVSSDATQIGAVDVTLIVARGGRAQTYTSTAVVSGGGS
jgi:Tfp pilus assembly protein FimT